MSDSVTLSVMKLVGTGNDFLFIDARKKLPGKFADVARGEIVRKLCDRHFGLGADGLVFVEQAGTGYRWDFYNTDGSHAEMCGNATRCLGRWAQLQLGLSQIRFETQAGHATVSIDGADVSSFLDFVSATPKAMRLSVGARNVDVFWIDTGVPHFVVTVDSIPDARLQLDFIRALRFHPDGGSRGANVTLLKVMGPSSFETVTFERGVEDFTLSCGTGVIAAAAVGLKLSQSRAQILKADVTTPGGNLKVKFGDNFQGVTLTGPAEKVFETKLESSAVG